MQFLAVFLLGAAAFYVIKRVKEDREELIRKAAEFDKEVAENRKRIEEEKAKRGIK